VQTETEREPSGPQFPDRGVLDDGHRVLRDVPKVTATLPNCPKM
jgi:hypothetical protein